MRISNDDQTHIKHPAPITQLGIRIAFYSSLSIILLSLPLVWNGCKKDFNADRRVSFCRAIVGAPEAETPQAGVYRGGAVYKCDIAADDRCMLINFDSKGNNNFTSLFFFFVTISLLRDV